MNKLIFLHIPKTAGTSMRQIMEQEYKKNILNLYPPFPPKYFIRFRREKLGEGIQVFYGHLMYGVHERMAIPANYATILRDPIARVISFYNHHASHAHAPHYPRIQQGMSLLDFLESELSIETNNHMTRIIAGYPPRNSSLDDDTVLETALRNLQQDFRCVGIMEDLPKTLDIFKKSLGWQGDYQLPLLNVNPKRQVEQVDGATLEALKKYNRLDLELYDYVVKNCL